MYSTHRRIVLPLAGPLLGASVFLRVPWASFSALLFPLSLSLSLSPSLSLSLVVVPCSYSLSLGAFDRWRVRVPAYGTRPRCVDTYLRLITCAQPARLPRAAVRRVSRERNVGTRAAYLFLACSYDSCDLE
jgi:hypothetical protein